MNERQLLETIMDRLAGLPDALRQTLNDSLWQSIAGDNYESSYSPAQTKSTPLVCQPKTTNIFRVELVVAVIPSGATGVLQLADTVIPISQGLTSFNGMRLQLAQNDLRSVTSDTAGPVALLLTGLQLPPASIQTR